MRSDNPIRGGNVMARRLADAEERLRATDERPSRIRRRRGRVIAVPIVVLVIVIAVAARHAGPLRAPAAPVMAPPPAGDPFTYRPARAAEFTARATAGEAHVLFSASPGGALATAARVSRLRGLINAATRGTGIDPNLLEALVFVESAGRPDAVTPAGADGAAGLTQIEPGTATSLLGLRVDLPHSRSLTGAIGRAIGNGATPAAISRLERRRAQVDQRFDAAKALAGAVRYLELARSRFGRTDLAVVSYHMGMGNLSNVLSAYNGGVAVPYVQLYFDTAPDRHPAAFTMLAGFGDQSSLYYWRVLGAEALMQLYRTDRAALTRFNTLQTDSDSAAEVLHPPDRTPPFADPSAVEAGYTSHALHPLPANASALGLAYGRSIGELAAKLHAPAGLYRGLRPAALTLLLELAARVRTLAHGQEPLTVASAVVDQRYQQLLGQADPPAAAGWSFTLARQYVGGAQRDALQAMLDRLQALNLIAWTRYPSEIEVTVASDAAQVIAHGV